jgi:16S rRNA (cytosine1402-N4)-methyltransferase
VIQEPFHDPVMVDAILCHFNLRPGSVVVDGTIGLAGHSLRFSDLIAPGGVIYGFDWDRAMLKIAEERLESKTGVTVRLHNKDYREIGNVLDEDGVVADATLLDMGLNSAHLDDPTRGISFKHDAFLDMRMNTDAGETAADYLNSRSAAEIEDALFKYSDERWARAIAKKIVERRALAPMRTTTDLVESVLAAVPVAAREKRIHPATRTFQAIRLAVTKELENLEDAVGVAADHLAPGGTICVLTYHSGEDRATKLAFRARHNNGFTDVTRKPELPTEAEISRNPRSRSAKLRVLRRDLPDADGLASGVNAIQYPKIGVQG